MKTIISTHAPVLPSAAAFAGGSLLAFHLPWVSLPLWGALALLGLALRRRAGICLAFLAFGVIAATVRLGLPEDPLAGFDLDRPVEAVVRISGHWTPEAGEDGGWAAPADLLRLRQEGRIAEPSVALTVRLAGSEEPPAYGSRLRIKGYLTRSSGFANRVAVPPGPWRLRAKSRALVEIEAPPDPVAALSGALRRRVDRAYRQAGPESAGDRQGKAMARALVLGDASGLPLAWKRGLRLTGTYHLMSVSGVHVALVAGAVWLLGGRLPRTLRLLLMLVAIGLYLLLVGPLPALVRSAVMALLAVLALLVERPPAAANALGWAVLLLALLDPRVVQDPAFQLTVAATAGLLLAAPPLAERWRKRLPGWLALALAASVAAQLFTLPWALPRYPTLAPLAPLLNLAAVPWSGVVLLASLLWTGLAVVAPGLAGSLLPVLDLLAAPFGWPAHTRPDIWLALPVLIEPWAAWLLAGGIGCLLFVRPQRTVLRAAALAAGCICVTACLWAPLAGHRERGPELAMLDVGQGDSILLRDGKHAVLVDGGGWDHGDLGGRVLLPALLAEGVRSLDAVVMTHPDHDHCGGLVDIAAYLPVREVWMGAGWEPKGCAGSLMHLPGARTRLLWAGEEAAVGRWHLRVLHPEADERRGTNERSLVIRAEVFGRSVLLTGDIESWAEFHLLSCCEWDVRVDLLKVAHHGSKTSSTSSFLDAARPRLALISAGVRNIYHHPSETVLERLEERGIPMLRTDRDGMVLVRVREDGRWRIETPGAPR
ncbi:MAG TPA: DNA internalization-related competence protein ComEC/Rec2 [Thermoanaerobaculia bacterium]|nr:DNA internalization-related competence protein ComEC/Rec2 [Thermoanaerobaculia bacterium]